MSAQTTKHAHTASLMTALCRWIEQQEQVPRLAEMASQAGLSPWHLHRQFKAIVGITPREYALAQQAQRLRQTLRDSPSVTEACQAAGFEATSRFYAHSQQRLGMVPGRYREGGAREEIRFALGQCSLGAILVAATRRGLCAIALGDTPEPLLQTLQEQFPRATLVGGDEAFEQWVAQVIGLVEDPSLGLDLPLDIRGTAFQQRVWQALRDIPPGDTASYSEIAQRIGAPGASRAVAKACASNRLAVAIPCHRVVRTDGGLSGYRWGVARKQALLEREAGNPRD